MAGIVRLGPRHMTDPADEESALRDAAGHYRGLNKLDLRFLPSAYEALQECQSDLGLNQNQVDELVELSRLYAMLLSGEWPPAVVDVDAVDRAGGFYERNAAIAGEIARSVRSRS